MKSESIKGRFVVDWHDPQKQGNPFFVTTDVSHILELGLQHNDKWHTTDITEGRILTIEDHRYIIRSVLARILDETHVIDEPSGSNTFYHGGEFSFNVEIRCYVEPVE